MSTTFNGLVLDELGTVGNPTVEYANFVTELSSPAGYDGAVLKNFKRDYTTIQFDLTLGGTEGECINKLNLLVAELAKGQGELVMPGQAERGTHFDAVPNMVITHNLRGFDGMTVPMTFVVPSGLAIAQNTIPLEGVFKTEIINNSEYPMQFIFRITAAQNIDMFFNYVAKLDRTQQVGVSQNTILTALYKGTKDISAGEYIDYSTETLSIINSSSYYFCAAEKGPIDLSEITMVTPLDAHTSAEYELGSSHRPHEAYTYEIITEEKSIW